MVEKNETFLNGETVLIEAEFKGGGNNNVIVNVSPGDWCQEVSVPRQSIKKIPYSDPEFRDGDLVADAGNKNKECFNIWLFREDRFAYFSNEYGLTFTVTYFRKDLPEKLTVIGNVLDYVADVRDL